MKLYITKDYNLYLLSIIVAILVIFIGFLDISFYTEFRNIQYPFIQSSKVSSFYISENEIETGIKEVYIASFLLGRPMIMLSNSNNHNMVITSQFGSKIGLKTNVVSYTRLQVFRNNCSLMYSDDFTNLSKCLWTYYAYSFSVKYSALDNYKKGYIYLNIVDNIVKRVYGLNGKASSQFELNNDLNQIRNSVIKNIISMRLTQYKNKVLVYTVFPENPDISTIIVMLLNTANTIDLVN